MTASWAHRALFSDFVNAIRLKNITALNLVIILILVFFLAKLTTKYKELYMINSLFTIIVTNLVLYGISESLAQALLSFDKQSPLISFILFDPEKSRLNAFTSGLWTSPNSPFPYPPYTDSVNETRQEEGRNLTYANRPTNAARDNPFVLQDSLHDTSRVTLEPPDSDSDVDEDNLDRFIDYLRHSDTDLPHRSFNDSSVVILSTHLSHFNFARLAGFMCWGFIMAFVQCWWYRFLQIYSKHPQFVEVLRKVMSDQFCFSPLSLFCFFTYGTMVLESGTWNDTLAKLRKLYLQTLLINYCVWFPVQFINFLLVPRDLQVPFSSSVSVLWNCFLSMRNSSSSDT